MSKPANRAGGGRCWKSRVGGRIQAIWAFCWWTFLAGCGGVGTADFSIPAGNAEQTLKDFANQAGVEIVYQAEIVAGVRTQEVKGRMEKGEALKIMLAGTPLRVTREEASGAFAISRLDLRGRTQTTQAAPDPKDF